MSIGEAKLAFNSIMVSKDKNNLFDDFHDRFMFALGLRSAFLEIIDDADWQDFMKWTDALINDIIGGFVFK